MAKTSKANPPFLCFLKYTNEASISQATSYSSLTTCVLMFGPDWKTCKSLVKQCNYNSNKSVLLDCQKQKYIKYAGLFCYWVLFVRLGQAFKFNTNNNEQYFIHKVLGIFFN